jgi:hypothetical protein
VSLTWQNEQHPSVHPSVRSSVRPFVRSSVRLSVRSKGRRLRRAEKIVHKQASGNSYNNTGKEDDKARRGLSSGTRFEKFITLCILSNTGTMMLNHFGQSAWLAAGTTVANQIFALIFTVEAVVKLGALGKYYFTDSWNIFDLVLVIVSDAGLVLSWLGVMDLGALASVLRTFRVARVLRLVKQWRGLHRLFLTLYATLPGTWYGRCQYW